MATLPHHARCDLDPVVVIEVEAPSRALSELSMPPSIYLSI